MLAVLKKFFTPLLVAGAGAFAFLVLYAASEHPPSLAFDMRDIVLRASDALVHGQPIYFPPWTSGHPFSYVYPPLYAEVCTPLLLVPAAIAAWVLAVGSLAAVLGALWIVGVRDMTVLALAGVSSPVLLGGQVANAQALVCLLVAVTVRYGRSLPLATAVALKLMAWPLTFWLAFTQSTRRASAAVVAAAALILLPWAVIGFQGFTFYPQVVRADAKGQYGATYGLTMSGLPHGAVVAGLATAVALVFCWRRTRQGDHVGAFAFGVAATLAAAPIVWGYYFTLVLLALALRRPRFSPAWLLPLLFWVFPGPDAPVTTFDKLFGWALIGGMLVWLGSGAEPPRWPSTRTHHAL